MEGWQTRGKGRNGTAKKPLPTVISADSGREPRTKERAGTLGENALPGEIFFFGQFALKYLKKVTAIP